MDERKMTIGLIMLAALASLYVAVSTLAVLQAMQRNFETIRKSPLSVETVTTTFATAYSIIIWILFLLLFALVICLLLALFEPDPVTAHALDTAWIRR